MTLPNEAPLKKLQFYVTTPYKCGYLPQKLAQSLIASPHTLVTAQVYSGLIQQGFRRSGKFAYRPHCEQCRACIPVRIVLDTFTPTRSQRRALKQHGDLEVLVLPIGFYPAHYALYSAYQQARHAEASLDDVDDPEQYQQFLCQSNVESLMLEFRDAQQQLVMVSVVDMVQDGVSAVYTFYDTSNPKNSYGTLSILWLCEWAKTLSLPYLYLGYWIADSPKMAYKHRFNPQEMLVDGEWTRKT